MKHRRAKGEGSIYHQAHRDLWVAKVPVGYNSDGSVKYRKLYAKTQKEARLKMEQCKVDLATNTYVTPHQVTYNDWVDSWLKITIKNSIKQTTWLLYESLIRNHIKPEFEGIKLVNLKTANIKNLYNKKLEVGLSPQTIRHMHKIIKQSIEQAIAENLLTKDISKPVKLPRLEKKEMKTLTKDQAENLLKIARTHKYYHRLYPAYLLELFSGLRRGELLGLRWCDIDFDRSVIKIFQQLVRVGSAHEIQDLKTESSQNRVIAVPANITKALKEYQSMRKFQLKALDYSDIRIKQHFKDGLVFVTTNREGTDITNIQPKNFIRNFKSLLKNAGLDNMRFHDLRHSFAVLSLQAGVDIKTLQNDLGHGTIETTLNDYGHVNIEMKKDAANKRAMFLTTS